LSTAFFIVALTPWNRFFIYKTIAYAMLVGPAGLSSIAIASGDWTLRALRFATADQTLLWSRLSNSGS